MSGIDKKDYMYSKNIKKELNEADKIISQHIWNIIPLFLLNINEIVFPSIRRSVRQ